MIQGKVWGNTKLLISNSFIEVHYININPNSFCSVHKHEFKWNGFYVVRGKIFIEVYKNNYDLVDTTELKEGDFTTVKPGEYHKFYTTSWPAEVLEIYYPEGLSEDIVRKTVGGCSQKQES